MPRENFIGSGAECRVYLISPGLVMKTYHLKGERDRAFERQKMARRAGFAPPTFGVCKDGRRHGYISARADTSRRLSGRQFRALERRMEALGLDGGDVCQNNAGYYKGKSVVIDFGDISTEECPIWRPSNVEPGASRAETRDASA